VAEAADSAEPAYFAVAESVYFAMALAPVTLEASPGDEPFPTDIPGYPGASLQMAGLTEAAQRFASLLTSAPAAEVYVYYRRAIFASGWRIEAEAQRQGRFTLVVRKQGRSLSIRVDSIGSGSEIAILTPAIEAGAAPSA